MSCDTTFSDVRLWRVSPGPPGSFPGNHRMVYEGVESVSSQDALRVFVLSSSSLVIDIFLAVFCSVGMHWFLGILFTFPCWIKYDLDLCKDDECCRVLGHIIGSPLFQSLLSCPR